MARNVRELILALKGKGIQSTGRDVGDVNEKSQQTKSTWKKLGPAGDKAFKMAGAAALAATAAITAVGAASAKTLIKTGSQLENYELQLRTVLHDSDEAKKLLKWIKSFSFVTPFEIPGLIEASIQLESFGLVSENTLEAVGDSAAAMNKDLISAAQAVTQGMLGEMEMLKQFTITSANITKQLGHDINRDTIEGQREVGEAILEVMRQKFGGGMAEMSKTWSGTITNISGLWFKLRDEIASGGFFDTAKEDLGEFYQMINNFDQKGGLKAVSVGFNNAFEVIHAQFFEPLWGDFDTTKFKAATMAADIELAFLKTTEGVGKFAMSVETAGKLWKKAIGFIPGKGDKFSDFSDILDEHSRAYHRNYDYILETIDALETFKKVQAGTLTEGIINLNAFLDASKKDFAEYRAEWRDMGLLQDFAPKVKAEGRGKKGPFHKTPGGGEAPETPDEYNQLLLASTHDAIDEMNELYASNWEMFLGFEGGKAVIHNESLASMAEADIEYFNSRNELAFESSIFYISQQEQMEMATNDIYGSMLKYQLAFAKKGANIGRTANAMLIRGAGAVAKATIGGLTRVAKIKALQYSADALALLAHGNFAGAATMAAAAAKQGLIVGAGAIASQLIENEIASREQALLGQEPNLEAAAAGSTGAGATTRGSARGSASTVKTGTQVNNFNILITNNIDGDYVVAEGKLTDAEQIQALFDEGLVQIAA